MYVHPCSWKHNAYAGYIIAGLIVSVAQPLKWDSQIESRVDKFLDAWPSLRQSALEHVFNSYRDSYDDIRDFLVDGPEDEPLVPEPTSPAAIADNFRIISILPSGDGSIRIGGNCTWDDEHGIEIVIDADNQIVGA